MQRNVTVSEILKPGLLSLKRNWPPIVIIQIVAALLLWSFYSLSGVQDVLERVGEAKVAAGILGIILSGAVAGGLIPEIAKGLTRKLGTLNKHWLEKTLFAAFVYAIIGLFVDELYYRSGLMFGTGHDVSILARKVALDIFVFTPFISMPVACGLFAFYEARYKPAVFWATLTNDFVRKKLLPSTVMCWAFWLPVLICVYAFPKDLQFPIAMLAEAAWSVLFVFMNTEQQA